MQSYKADKIDAIKEIMKLNPVTIIEEEGEEYERYPVKKKATGEPKKTTLEETFELWQQKLSIKEIAERRKLTETTILSHFAGLIQSGKAEVSDVLPEEKILALKEAFKDFDGESLKGLKDKYGDAFTWGELRIYKAGLE
jgi:uncharacterized protein YpbB